MIGFVLEEIGEGRGGLFRIRREDSSIASGCRIGRRNIGESPEVPTW